jgi:AraC family transcriptional regulator
VIDVALKYGYESPDSFARAFTKFHGISPSSAKEQGSKLNSFAPLRIKLTLEGGTMLEYKIVEKPQFTVVGKSHRFNMETSYKEIPRLWYEHLKSDDHKILCGVFGIAMDCDGENFDYLIADNYVPWNDIPEGFVTKVIPAGTWAVFPCRGALPEALQSVNSKIWSEWVPSCKAYKLAGNYNIEMYAKLVDDPNYSEIWIPVEKV